MGKALVQDYRLREKDTGREIAVYLGSGLKSWSKKGELVLVNEVDAVMEVFAILGAVGLIVKALRRARWGNGLGWAGLGRLNRDSTVSRNRRM